MIRDVFPWAELALQGAALGAVSLLLLGMASDAAGRLRAVEAELAAFPWAKGMDQRRLDEEKKGLEERTKTIAAFRGSRVPWSIPLRTIAASAPESTVIKSLSGDSQLEAGGRPGPAKKKQLDILFKTPMAEEGSPPREIESFVASLRVEPALRRHFPLIDVVGLQATAGKSGEPPSASYRVVCLPKAEKAPAPAPPKAARPSK